MARNSITVRIPPDLGEWIDSQNLTPTELILGLLRSAKDGHLPPAAPQPPAPDLAPILARLDALETRLNALTQPPDPVARPTQPPAPPCPKCGADSTKWHSQGKEIKCLSCGKRTKLKDTP